MNLKAFTTVVLLTYFRLIQSRNYNDYKLYKAVPKTKYHLEFLTNLEKQKYLDVSFWKRPSKLYHDVHFIVNPADGYLLLERAKHYNLELELLLPNLQRAINDQIVRRYYRFREDKYSWESYHDLEDVYQWLMDISLKFPNVVKLQDIGASVEGRVIHAVSINRNNNPKGKVIIEGGIHGTDWVAVEFMTYLIHNLVHAEEKNEYRLHTLAKKYHWLVIPIVNPDGFDYSHKTDRLWVKNRRFLGNNTYGINLNRNFDYSFGKFCPNDTTSSEYCGPNAFSEPETKAVADFVSKNSRDLKFYFAIHAYGQKIIIPYSDRVQHIENFSELQNYGKQAVQRLYTNTKTKYGLGTTYDTYGLKISGTSESWVKRKFGLRYVATFQLRDNGSYGYMLPADQIIPACKEGYSALIDMMTAKPKYVPSMYSETTKITVNIITVLSCVVLSVSNEVFNIKVTVYIFDFIVLLIELVSLKIRLFKNHVSYTKKVKPNQ